MNKKIINICSILLIMVFVLLCGAYCIYDNYRFGQELYQATNEILVQSRALADSIGVLEGELQIVCKDYDDVNGNGFYLAINSVQSQFGYENMPILDDVRMEYIYRFEKLYIQTVNDHNNAKLVELFTNPATASEINALKRQLNTMTECFVDFNEKYNEMSILERCFFSWEDEREVLTEKVRIP